MSSDEQLIKDVSDTSLWVAHFRAEETERPDALFKDPLAKSLIGDRGEKIANSMRETSRYSRWTVVIRTVIIDRLIQQLIAEGVDTVINLGAGMDTRPYRMKLPSNIQWVEIDYPHIIHYKEKTLVNEKPNVNLKRIALDLANREERQRIFAELSSYAKKALIITEGVIVYLTEDQVKTLGEDLRTQNHFHYWITEYFTPRVYPYLKSPIRMKKLKNAPFQFFPKDWLGFFKNIGWKQKDLIYLPKEAAKLNRMMPMPWWAHLVTPFLNKKKIEDFMTRMGFVLFEKD